MNWYLKVLRQYADFSGRARRTEYWMFFLFNMLFAIVAMILDNVFGITIKGIGYGPVYGLYVLAMIIPGLAVTVRRLHDVGKSGSMILIAFIPLVGAIWLLVLMFTKSEPKENKYGETPIVAESVDSTTEQLIFIFILVSFFSRSFYFIGPKIYNLFYESIVFAVVEKSLILLFGIIPLAFAFKVKNKSLKIISFILGGLMFFNSLYQLGLKIIK